MRKLYLPVQRQNYQTSKGQTFLSVRNEIFCKSTNHDMYSGDVLGVFELKAPQMPSAAHFYNVAKFANLIFLITAFLLPKRF